MPDGPARTDPSVLSIILGALIIGALAWLLLSVIAFAFAFPGLIARRNQPPLPLRVPVVRRLFSWVPCRAWARVAHIGSAGLSVAALERALVLEMHQPFLAIRSWVGQAVIYFSSLLPVFVLLVAEQAPSTPPLLVYGPARFLALLFLLPFILVVLALFADMRIEWTRSFEMQVWSRFRDLLDDGAVDGRWWRSSAVRRAARLSSLIEALERDLLRFRGVRRHETRVVPRVMEVVATFEQRSDTTALSPASPLDADAVIAAVDEAYS